MVLDFDLKFDLFHVFMKQQFYGKYHGNVDACACKRYQAVFSPSSRPEYEAKGDLLVAVYIMLRKPEKMGGKGGGGRRRD